MKNSLATNPSLQNSIQSYGFVNAQLSEYEFEKMIDTDFDEDFDFDDHLQSDDDVDSALDSNVDNN